MLTPPMHFEHLKYNYINSPEKGKRYNNIAYYKQGFNNYMMYERLYICSEWQGPRYIMNALSSPCSRFRAMTTCLGREQDK